MLHCFTYSLQNFVYYCISARQPCVCLGGVLTPFDTTAAFHGRGAVGPATFISAAISFIKTHEAPWEWKTKLLIMWSRLQRCSSGQNHNTETLPFKAISSDQYVNLEMSNKGLKSHDMFCFLSVDTWINVSLLLSGSCSAKKCQRENVLTRFYSVYSHDTALSLQLWNEDGINMTWWRGVEILNNVLFDWPSPSAQRLWEVRSKATDTPGRWWVFKNMLNAGPSPHFAYCSR